MNKKVMIGLAVLSMLLTGLILTSYASLGDVLGDDFDTNVEEFGSAELAAAQSGAAVVPATPPPPPTNYATENMKVFSLSSGVIEVYGFAPKSSAGILAGRFNPDTDLPKNEVVGWTKIFEGDHGWYIQVYLVDKTLFGQSVFQVNLHDPAGVLKDDGFRLRVG